jgi:hypothetical protein
MIRTEGEGRGLCGEGEERRVVGRQAGALMSASLLHPSLLPLLLPISPAATVAAAVADAAVAAF